MLEESLLVADIVWLGKEVLELEVKFIDFNGANYYFGKMKDCFLLLF